MPPQKKGALRSRKQKANVTWIKPNDIEPAVDDWEADLDRFVGREPTLRQVAKPLVHVSLARLAAGLEHGLEAMISLAQRPAAKLPAVEQIVEGGHQLTVMIHLEVAAIGQRAVYDLPRGLVFGIEMPVRQREVECPIDPVAQLVVAGQFGLRYLGNRLATAAQASATPDAYQHQAQAA